MVPGAWCLVPGAWSAVTFRTFRNVHLLYLVVVGSRRLRSSLCRYPVFHHGLA